MTAPISRPLTGLADYESATYKTSAAETVVTLKKKEGSKEHWITITFQKPMDSTDLVSYLNAKQTKDKIGQMVQQYDLFSRLYGKKPNFHIESRGKETYIFYEKQKTKGGHERIDISEAQYQATCKKIADAYQEKINKARREKNDAQVTKSGLKKDNFLDLMKEFEKISQTILTPLPEDKMEGAPSISVSEPPLPSSPKI